MPSQELVPWGEQFVSRDRQRQRREERRFWGRVILGCSIVFGSLVVVAVVVNRPEREAAATEVPAPTSAPLSPVFARPTTPTTVVVPESAPTSIAPLWVTVKVAVPGWEGLGKLVTDGQPRDGHGPRILPGDLGQSVIAIDGDPSSAQTIVIEGVPWRVFEWGQVPANAPGDLIDHKPTFPTVVLVSTAPGDMRNYVRARR